LYTSKIGIYFVFESAICAFNEKYVSLVDEDIRRSRVQSALFFPAPLYTQADFLRVVPVCAKLGYTT